MKRIEYFLFRTIVAFAASLSIKNMYRASTFFRILLYNVIGYRKAVVIKNLSNSFSDKSETEIKTIAKDYYQNLCDLMIETFASYGWADSMLKEKFKFKNPELLDFYKQKYQGWIGVTGHFGNFELGAVSIPSQLAVNSYAVYRPLANTLINNYIVNKRTRTGVNIFDSKGLKENLPLMQKPYIFFLLADQSPSKIEKAYWVNFLNQKTAFTHGPADLSISLNLPILYIDIKTIARGYYEAELKVLLENPTDHKAQEIVQIIANQYEKTIKNAPADWLWSHKRWKWTLKDGKPMRI